MLHSTIIIKVGWDLNLVWNKMKKTKLTSKYSACMSKTDMSSNFLISESGKMIAADDFPSEHIVKTLNLRYSEKLERWEVVNIRHNI